MSQDRNAVARQEFADRSANAAVRKARETFVGDFQLGRAGALDRFGNMVREGDSVLFKLPNDPVMEVKSVAPSMDPSHPVGAIKMILTCEIPVLFGANQPSQSMVRIGSRKMIADAEARVAAAQAANGPLNGVEANGGVQQPAADGGDVADPDDPTDPGDTDD